MGQGEDRERKGLDQEEGRESTGTWWKRGFDSRGVESNSKEVGVQDSKLLTFLLVQRASVKKQVSKSLTFLLVHRATAKKAGVQVTHSFWLVHRPSAKRTSVQVAHLFLLV